MTAKTKIKAVCTRCSHKYKVPVHIELNEVSICPTCVRAEREQRKKFKKNRNAAMKRRRENKRGMQL